MKKTFYILAAVMFWGMSAVFCGCSQIQTEANTKDTAAYSVGPGGGGALFHPTFNPQDADNYFISCDMGSAFVTHDGGESFKSLKLGRGVAYAQMPRWWFTPHNSNTVYATVGTIVYVSYDKGLTWDFMFPSKNDYIGLAHVVGASSDTVGTVQPHFKTGILRGDYCFMSFLADPNDKNVLYVMDAGKSHGWPLINGKVFRSIDSGKTWEVFCSDLGATLWVNDLMGRSAQMLIYDNELRISTHEGLFRVSLQNGKLIEGSIGGKNVANSRYGSSQSMVVNDGELTVYMTRWGQLEGSSTGGNENHVYKTTDFGKTWTPLTLNFASARRYPCTESYGGCITTGPEQYRCAVPCQGRTFHQHAYDNWQDKNFNIHKYPTYFGYVAAVGKRLYVSFRLGADQWYAHGVAMTENDGATWTLVNLGSRLDSRTGQGDYENFYDDVSPIDLKAGNSSALGRSGLGLCVNPSNPDEVISTNYADAFYTANGGKTWTSLASRRTDGGKSPVPAAGETPFFTTTGIEPAGQSVLAIDPFDSNHHMSGWTDMGMFESFDGGKSWTYRVVEGLSNADCHAIAFDPHNEGTVLALLTPRQGGQGGDDNIFMLRDPYTTTRAGGIARSTDGGKTWTPSYTSSPTKNLVSDPANSGLPTRTAISKIIFDPVNENVVYAAVMGNGVYKSTDNGVTWAPFNKGIPLHTRLHTVTYTQKSGDPLYDGHQTYINFGYKHTTAPSGTDTVHTYTYTHSGIVAAVFMSKSGKELFAVSNGIAYKLDTANKSDTWTALGRPDGTKISGIEMDANGILYANTAIQMLSNEMIPFGDGGTRADVGLGGAWVSNDGGTIWRQIFDETYLVIDIKSDSRNGNTLYISTRAGDVLVSTKGKDTALEDWTKLEGFPFHYPGGIYEDPQNTNRIYVTSSCGGTWSLYVPVNADPNATDTTSDPSGEPSGSDTYAAPKDNRWMTVLLVVPPVVFAVFIGTVIFIKHLKNKPIKKKKLK